MRTGGCRPGDAVLLAGSAGVEGTSIIAREMGEALLAQGWSEADLDEAANYLYEPGISVLGAGAGSGGSGTGDGDARSDGGRCGDGIVGDG